MNFRKGLETEPHHDNPRRNNQLGRLKTKIHHRKLVNFGALGHEDQEHGYPGNIHWNAQPHQPAIIYEGYNEIDHAPHNDPHLLPVGEPRSPQFWLVRQRRYRDMTCRALDAEHPEDQKPVHREDQHPVHSEEFPEEWSHLTIHQRRYLQKNQ